ncbi:GH25 family lysozyme [Brevibacillus choshinensis]|uniref:GH25 family lysozyme n=1 Tax=Brevibacillus choshinensis TaxID=54911 RepID=UPI002E22B350|nr:GH25 family lysozyme [Brevibacillus choshinensis]MED4586681.1 GH25 family lysozyme [Brevibacillus choshinensis]
MQTRNPNNIKVIDVSHHQGEIDWKKVVADGVKGVFIKATEGIGYTDPLFRKNVQNALGVGLKVGLYHFTHPDNSPTDEAKYFADTVKGLNAELPLVLDMEQTKNRTASQLTVFASAWLIEVERLTGKRVMIYTGASFARSFLGPALYRWPLWVAHYGVDQPMSNPTWDRWTVFQYTSSGKVNGITGSVDMNEMDLAYWNNLFKVNPQPVDKKADAKTQAALKTLQTAGVIQTPDYWIQNAFDGGQVKGEYAALLIQNIANKLSGTTQPTPTPVPEPEQPAPTKEPKDWKAIEEATKAASVYVDLMTDGTAVVLKNGYLLTAQHVSKGKAALNVKTQAKRVYRATLLAEHPGIGKESIDLALYRLEDAPANLPYLPLATDILQLGERLLTVEAEYTKQTVRTGEACVLSNPTWPWKFSTSIPVNSGNSGGAVVNQYGELIGIVIQIDTVNVTKGSVSQVVPGGRCVNLLYPAVADWLKQYLK